jgi:hypothetical protein
MYVYDLKARKPLGRVQAASLAITPSRPGFYAIAPQAIAPVALKAARSLALGNAARVTVVSNLPEGQQAAKIVVTLPDGRAADWVRAVVVAGRQGAALDVPVAYNDPRGTWTIQATELYTGATSTTQFTVP